MGNAQMSGEFSTRRFLPQEREAMKKFCEDEIHLLRETFKGLANAKNGYTVDRETFLKCFPMPGLLGERLFEVIDKDGSGTIGYNEFVYGLAILFRGTRTEKLRFIFDLYDLSESGSISRYELVTMLHQFPESALDLLHPNGHDGFCIPSPLMQSNGVDDIDALVQLAFPEGPSTNARLTFAQFTEWCESTPGIVNFLMSVLPSEDDGNAALVTPVDSNTLSGDGPPDIRKRRSSIKSLHSTHSCMSRTVPPPANQKELEKTRQLLLEAKQQCPIEALATKIQSTIQDVDQALQNIATNHATALAMAANPGLTFASPSSSPDLVLTPRQSIKPRLSLQCNDIASLCLDDPDHVSGDLWKRGSRLRQMMKRHYVLQGNFLYYYTTKEETAPRGVTFLCGCYIESTSQPAVMEKNIKYYAIDIVPEPGSNREKRTIYTKTLDELVKWTTAFRRATDKKSIDEYYSIGRELGTGRFSRVCEGMHKYTKQLSAVKIIDKSKLSITEKELLRTEIAILKLVTHSNIIQLYDIYEDRINIYLVTELVNGGDLYKRINGRSRYTESEARMVMSSLLESVAYLHRLGIVHRDIKPENILCGEKLSDLKIADFGLSKLVHPEEIMKMPCGTLNYVAPEVLSLVGYGKEADIWSVGVIMYLLLRGELPFYSKTKNEIIQKTLHAEINFDKDIAMSSISPSCKSLLKGLLTKEPCKRFTAADALKHEWFNTRTGRNESTRSPRSSITGGLTTTIM